MSWARFCPMPDTVWSSDSVARFKRTLPFFLLALTKLQDFLNFQVLEHPPFFSNIDHCFIGEFLRQVDRLAIGICCHPACLINGIVDSAIGAQLIDTWLFDGSFDIDRNDLEASDTKYRLFFFGTSSLHLSLLEVELED